VGYRETLKAYKIFIPMHKKIVVKIDAKFEEYLEYWKSQEPLLVKG
jgi:hypothetical protein